MKIAMLIPDNRDEFKTYSDQEPQFGPAPTALLEGFAQLTDCEVHVICCTHQPLRSPIKLAANIWFHSLVVPRWGWRAAYLGCVWALRKKLRELQPEVVHGQGTERYCALAAALSGFPNVITIHGNMRAVSRALRAKIFSLHWFAGLLEGFTLARTGGLICLTRYTKEQTASSGVRTWLVPNAVDDAFFQVRRRPPAAILVLCAANAAVYKNQVRLIRALDALVADHPLTLMLAGSVSVDEPYGAEMMKLCAERSWCHHVGSLGRDALRKLLAQTTLLVLPSLEDNCPMVILEAMAAGVPVAASHIGGIPDLIEEGLTGLMFDPLSESDIRAAVKRSLDNPTEREAMATKARDQAQTRFSPISVARRHLAIYRELLGTQSSRTESQDVTFPGS